MAIMEVLLWVGLSFTFCIVLVFMLYANNVVTSEMDTVFNNAQVTSFFTKMNNIWSWLDYVLIVSYISFIAGSVVLGYFINSHPVFYVPYMVGAFFVTFVAWIFREVLGEVMSTLPGIQSLYNSFPLTQYFMTNLPYFTLIACVVIATIQYSKASKSFISQY